MRIIVTLHVALGIFSSLGSSTYVLRAEDYGNESIARRTETPPALETSTLPRAITPTTRLASAMLEYRSSTDRYISDIPEYRTIAPEYRSIRGRRVSDRAEYGSIAPEYRSIMDRQVSAIPEYRSVAPEYRSVVDRHVSAIPEYRSVVDRHASAIPPRTNALHVRQWTVITRTPPGTPTTTTTTTTVTSSATSSAPSPGTSTLCNDAQRSFCGKNCFCEVKVDGHTVVCAEELHCGSPCHTDDDCGGHLSNAIFCVFALECGRNACANANACPDWGTSGSIGQ